MKKILCALALCFVAAAGSAQTNTPTNTPTPTATLTPTPTFTSTPTFTPTITPTLTSQKFLGPHRLVVPSGATLSNQIELNPNMRWTLTILVPASIDGTVTMEVAEANGGTFKTYQNPAGTDLALAAGKAVPTGEFSGGQLQIREGSSAAAQRVFWVTGSAR